MTREPACLFSLDAGVATVQLNRPHRLNALNGEVFDGLQTAVKHVTEDKSAHALIIRGNSRSFSTGVDLAYLDNILTNNRRYFAFVEHFNAVLRAVETCPVPTIAVVEGFALAGGLELLLATDFAFATTDAVFGDQHANFGLLPGGGSTQRLPRRVGEQRAKDLLFTGRSIDAQEAHRIGLVLEIAEPGVLDDAVQNFTAQLLNKSRTATAFVKRAVQRGERQSLPEALHHEAHAVAEFFTSSTSPAIGLQAFRAKERPVFDE